jgi:predicted NBD/HSP70 family sugar kinase
MPLYAGFDLGGTHLKFGLIDSNENIIFNSKTATPPTIGELLHLLEKLWDDLKKKDKRRIEAVGFGFPGIFSLEQQRILQSPNFAELDNFYGRIRRIQMRSRKGCPKSHLFDYRHWSRLRNHP